MTDVNPAAAPAAQAMIAGSADPPTIKNAGQIHAYGSSVLIGSLALLGVAALVAGGMLLAVMASHGQVRRGWILHTILGVAAMGLIALSTYADSFATIADMAGTAVGVGILWAVVAGMALAVGSLARPPRRPRRPA